MIRRTKTFTFEVHYNYFEPGTLVTPLLDRGVLEKGRIYYVTSCLEPYEYDDEAIVFVKANPNGPPRHWAIPNGPARQWGVSAANLREVHRLEITDDGKFLKSTNQEENE